MQIVIELADEIYEMKKPGVIEENINEIISAVIFGKPLPKGHGRLIDADAFKNEHPLAFVRDVIENAPTIIEADKEVTNG